MSDRIPPPDFLDPADEDWPSMDDTPLVSAAAAGIPQAVAELARRNKAARGDTPPTIP